MRVVTAIIGGALILLVFQDAFETIVLPRRVERSIRLVRFFFIVTWRAWRLLGRRMRPGGRLEQYLSYFGPLSLLGLIAFWAILFVLGWGLLLWGTAVPLRTPEQGAGFLTDLYLSGTTFFTLGIGDVVPQPGLARLFVVAEVALGFGFLALVISYVPIIYQAFSRRELRISLLDARAGSPATAVELLRRNCVDGRVEEVASILRDWETGCADILESHLSYPVLAYYRSQHEQQSWVEAVTVILDTCALILTGLEGIPPQTARFAFAMARHAVVDLAQTFSAAPNPGADRLSPADFAQLREALATAGINLSEGAAAEQRLAELRRTYEPFVSSLARFLLVSLPPWNPPVGSLDDWQTTAWDDEMPSTRRTLVEVMQRDGRWQ
jgi:hypothetical protein